MAVGADAAVGIEMVYGHLRIDANAVGHENPGVHNHTATGALMAGQGS